MGKDTNRKKKYRHQSVIDRMTLLEKTVLLSGKNEWQTWGVPRLGIPSFFLSDGPNGVRKQAGAGDHLGLHASLPATCFPPSGTVSNSWNEQLGEQIGQALGQEAAALNVQVLLGPGLNIKRSPLCGRNFEYFSEDPYLSGKLAAAYIRGIQSQGVSACPKHFAANSQELRRMAMNSVVDERTLREIYLTGFEIAVKEGHPKTIMSSYNQVNGIYANENPHLLKDILRDEWGYQGAVVTDWGGSNDHVAGVKAGSTLEMPNPGLGSARSLRKALKKGKISMEDIDRRVDEMLELIDFVKGNKRNAGIGSGTSCADAKENAETAAGFSSRTGVKQGTKTESEKESEKGSNQVREAWPGAEKDVGYDLQIQAHHRLAYKAACESMVLLKNEENILPLDSSKKVALIGDFAFQPRYQGAGSSLVNPTRLESMTDLAKQSGRSLARSTQEKKTDMTGLAKQSGRSAIGSIQESKMDLAGSTPQKGLNIIGAARGYLRHGGTDPELEEEALELAKKADVVLYCFGLDEIFESEGLDREHMRIRQEQIDLLEKLAKVNPHIVGVLSAGSAVEMPWDGYCQAILHTFLSGQAGAQATWDILTGKVTPSGKLSETYPIRYEDTPAYQYYPSKERNSEYREALYVGYRYYTSAGVPVKYPFGFGLSFTSFEYSDLTVSRQGVTFTVHNTGSCDGAEVAQMYVKRVSDSDRIFRPERELKGFRKVYLKAGESGTVTIPFDDKTFRYWSNETDRFETEEASWHILIGASSEDIRLRGTFATTGTADGHSGNITAGRKELPSYFSGKITDVDDAQFEALLGHPIPDGHWSRVLTRNDALCQMQHARGLLARLIFHILDGLKKAGERKGEPNLNVLFQYNMPFRALAKMSEGWISMMMVDGIVRCANLHIISGLVMIIVGFFANLIANVVDRIRLAVQKT